jgi:cysteine synthase
VAAPQSPLSGSLLMTSIIDHIGRTPLVRLRSWDTPVPLYAKCEHLNPGGSVKDRLAKAIIEEAEKLGRLRPGDTIVEATAGNTGVGLALLAAARGYRLVCVMPRKMSLDKRKALEALGAEVMIVADAPIDSPDNFRQTADRLAREHDWFLADQFRSPANVAAHREHTGPEIWQALEGRIGAFVAGAGTGGTISGVGQYLKSRCARIQIVLADPRGSGLAGWVETGQSGPSADYTVEGIGSSCPTAILDRSVIDHAVVIGDAESYHTALALQKREGLLVGGSSGTAVAAALSFARSGRASGPVVALLADSWDRYFSQPWMAPTPVGPKADPGKR